jgi:putative phosphoesterase
MDIGIISDIHGDYDALNTALDRLDQYHQVDQLLCAGDMVGRGPDSNAVVNYIRQRGIPTVRGNHDELMSGLTPENKIYLKALPIDWRGRYGKSRIFMCHGKPGNNLWGLYRDHISETLLNMMLASLRTDVLITGHTHAPLYMRVERGCVINPGSLYTVDGLRDSSHSYGILHLPDLTFDLYDLTTEQVEPMPLRGLA